ncbi:MAG: hypothetical protein IJJ33_09035 [Victivallales bacterium]|nr:hypothetical protein [Victivallales bacterium]
MKGKCLLAVIFAFSMISRGSLTIQEKDGGFSVLRDGKPFIESLRLSLGETTIRDAKRRVAALPDGGRVWNLWSEHPQTRVRLEIAQRQDGSIEITMASNVLPYSESKTRMVMLDFASGALDGKSWQSLEGNARAWRPQGGLFDTSFQSMTSHWLTTDGVLFDFNPMGAACYCNGYRMGAVKGVWNISRERGVLVFAGGSEATVPGGFTGCKLVIREGMGFEDYDRLHFMRMYHYNQHLLPSHLLAFGAPAYGRQYSNGNVAIGDGTVGWNGSPPQPKVGHKEGAFYSCVFGKDGHYQFKGLPDGFYVCTLAAGNYAGLPNRFSVRLGDDLIRGELTVAGRTIWIGSKTAFVRGGTLDIRLDGDFILSTIGLQPLMSAAEDYSLRRCFWVTEGYEPALIYRNADFPRTYTLPLAEEVLELPVPDTETSAAYRHPPRPTRLPSPDLPSLAWLDDMKMGNLRGGMNIAQKGCPQELRTALIDADVTGKGYNCVMSGFLHSRHTFPEHFQAGVEYNRVLAEECHRRNLKIIDHHDTTILWNQQSGLRTLAERLPELCRGLDDHLPSFQLCPLNPEFKRKYFEYWRKNVEVGIDGFQLDEVQFWTHSCSCRHCREAFTRDTGWIYPLNELSPALASTETLFYRRWHEWKMAAITNWFVELRECLEDIKPDLALSMYTTHWGFTRSLPKSKAGFDIMDLARTVNMFGTEVMTRNVMKSSRALLPLRKMKNVITREYGTRIWGIYYTSDWESSYFAWAVANMCGQSALMAFQMPKEAPAFGAFAKTSGNLRLKGAENIAEMALLFSAPSRDWNRSLGFEHGLFGLAQELEAMHIPYEMIANISLRPEILKKYKVLSLGSSACISDKERDAIMQFAQDGGTVMLTTVAGLCDETGLERKAWPFADVFGFTPKYFSAWSVKEIDGLPCDVPVRTFLNPASHNILCEERPYGKGRLIYRALDWEALFMQAEKSAREKWNYIERDALEERFRNHLAVQLASVAYWEVEAPSQVYTAIWKEADGTRCIHFLNATGVKMKTGEILDDRAPSPAFPPLGKDITFRVPGMATEVTAASPSFEGVRPLAFENHADNTSSVTLPAELALQYVIVKVK